MDTLARTLHSLVRPGVLVEHQLVTDRHGATASTTPLFLGYYVAQILPISGINDLQLASFTHPHKRRHSH